MKKTVLTEFGRDERGCLARVEGELTVETEDRFGPYAGGLPGLLRDQDGNFWVLTDVGNVGHRRYLPAEPTECVYERKK